MYEDDKTFMSVLLLGFVKNFLGKERGEKMLVGSKANWYELNAGKEKDATGQEKFNKNKES